MTRNREVSCSDLETTEGEEKAFDGWMEEREKKRGWYVNKCILISDFWDRANLSYIHLVKTVEV